MAGAAACVSQPVCKRREGARIGIGLAAWKLIDNSKLGNKLGMAYLCLTFLWYGEAARRNGDNAKENRGEACRIVEMTRAATRGCAR